MNYHGSDHDSVHSPGGFSSPDKVSTNSRALVAVPPADPNAGAVVPVNKSKRSPEQGQRRIRRPFSVAEVEALVLAVEKLGTGRYSCLFPSFDQRKFTFMGSVFLQHSYGYDVGGEMLNSALLTTPSTGHMLILR
jgi:hypothetical protein